MPENAFKMKSILAYAVEKSIDEARRSIRFTISSDEIDRDGERIEVSAIAAAIKDFAKNPVCIACHLHRLDNGSSPVIGSWDTDSYQAKAHTSEMDLVFATTALGEEYWNLYKSKHMRAVSIGFRILDGHEVVENSKRHFVITKIELYDISCVAGGANRQALSKVKGFDLNGAPVYGDTLERKDQNENQLDEINQRFDALEEQLESIKYLLSDRGQLAEEFLLGDASVRAAAADDPQSEDVQKLIDTANNIVARISGG